MFFDYFESDHTVYKEYSSEILSGLRLISCNICLVSLKLVSKYVFINLCISGTYLHLNLSNLSFEPFRCISTKFIKKWPRWCQTHKLTQTLLQMPFMTTALKLSIHTYFDQENVFVVILDIYSAKYIFKGKALSEVRKVVIEGMACQLPSR